MKKISIFIFSIFTLLNTENSNAAIALDRTRAIYGEGTKSISLKISNESSQLPYLAQAWVEDENFNKITKPLLITPPIQRIEPGTKSMVRISSLPEIKNLPQDRETLFTLTLGKYHHVVINLMLCKLHYKQELNYFIVLAL